MKTAPGLRIVTTIGLLLGAVFIVSNDLPDAGAKSNSKKAGGKEIFQQYCAACHVAGGNIVKPAKSIVDSKKLGTYALFKDYLNSPTGHMPYYENLCTNQKALKSLYNYVRTLESVKLKQAHSDSGFDSCLGRITKTGQTACAATSPRTEP